MSYRQRQLKEAIDALSRAVGAFETDGPDAYEQAIGEAEAMLEGHNMRLDEILQEERDHNG